MPTASPWDNDELLREELFSIERLEQHAVSLAVAQQVASQSAASPAARGAAERQRGGAARRLSRHRHGPRGKVARSRRPPSGCSTTTISSKRRSARSARTCRRASTASCRSSRTGPSSDTRACSASPGHSSPTTDSHFDPDTLRRFVRAYQTVQPLTIGELWAVAITLRIVLVENLRRAAQRIVEQPHGTPGGGRHRRPPARGQRASRGARRTGPDLRRGRGSPGGRRRRAGAATARPGPAGSRRRSSWLEERLAAQGTTAEAVVQRRSTSGRAART